MRNDKNTKSFTAAGLDRDGLAEVSTILHDVIGRLCQPQSRRIVRGVVLAGLTVTATYASAEMVQSLVYSATALAVALVMATKEMIVALFGGLVRNVGRAMKVGDVVEIGSYRGTVRSAGLFTTRIEETDDFGDSGGDAGRMVLIPNAKLFEDSVVARSKTAVRITTRFTLNFDGTRSMREVAEWWDGHADLRDDDAGVGASGGMLAYTLATNVMGKPCVNVSVRSLPNEAKRIQRDLTVDFLDWISGCSGNVRLAQPGRAKPADVVLELVA